MAEATNPTETNAMRFPLFAPLLLAALTCGGPARAQDHAAMMDHHMHMAAAADDHRQAVEFPPPMRQHILANMRDHLAALSEILAALGGGDYAKAGQIADARLGLDSPAAAGCQVGGDAAEAPRLSGPMDMEYMMALYMPEAMRNVGLAMHQAASDFAVEARKAATTHDAKPVFTDLGRITEQCSACHTAYKVQ